MEVVSDVMNLDANQVPDVKPINVYHMEVVNDVLTLQGGGSCLSVRQYCKNAQKRVSLDGPESVKKFVPFRPLSKV